MPRSTLDDRTALAADPAPVERGREWSDMAAFEAEVAVAAGVVNAADGALVELTARALAEDRWAGWEVHSPSQWLAWQMGLSRHKATTVLRVARRAAELPTVLRLLGEGRLSLDQAAAVARWTPAAYEASVCDLAVHATVAQIRAATREYDFDSDVRDRSAEPREPERVVTFGADDRGGWSARVRLPGDEGQVVQDALQVVRDRLHSVARAAARARAGEEGRTTTGTDAELDVQPVTWADALIGVAHATLAGGGEGAEVAVNVGVLVHLEAPGDTSETEGEWRATLHGSGLAMPPSLRRHLTCDASTSVAWSRDGSPVQVGRASRDVPRRVRRLVEQRDRHVCRVPGCTSTLWLQVHHIVHWEDHGLTVTWNLVCLCARHHRLHHRGLLGISGNPERPPGTHGALTFTNQHGLPIPDAGTPVPPVRSDMPADVTYRHPSGETLQRRWVHFDRHRQPDG